MVFAINADTILRLPLSKKIVILAAGYILIAAVYGYLGFYPKMLKAKELNLKIGELKKQIDNEAVTVSQLPRIKQEREEFAKKLQDAVAQMPNEKEIAGLLSSLSSLGMESGLEILLFKPGGEIVRGFYADVPVDMKVQGGYEGILLFFKKVSALQRIVNISRFSIGDGKESDGNIILTASFVATTFRYLKEEDIGKEKVKIK